MTAVFYKCACPKNVVDKIGYLTQIRSTSVAPYEPLDDLNGYLIVDGNHKESGNTTAEDESDYVKLSDITGNDRYYFIISRELMTGGRCKMRLEEDVLMTWKNIIKEANCVIDRAYLGGSEYMVTGDLPILGYQRLSEDSGYDEDFSYNDGNLNVYAALLVAGGSTAKNTSAINEIANKGLLSTIIGNIFG